MRECCNDKNDLIEEEFKATLLSCVEDSIRGILEEDGTLSNGVASDIRQLVELAKDIEFDDNKSFFSKVAAVTEGRCNSKFMDNLLDKLSTKGAANGLNTEEITERLINVLGSKGPLQEAFKEMVANNPDFADQVLMNLAREDQMNATANGTANAIDLLHSAIARTVGREMSGTVG